MDLHSPTIHRKSRLRTSNPPPDHQIRYTRLGELHVDIVELLGKFRDDVKDSSISLNQVTRFNPVQPGRNTSARTCPGSLSQPLTTFDTSQPTG